MTDIYTADEVALHVNADDLWIVIHGNVYNLSSFLKEHPGGPEVLVELAGKDGTECFEAIGHSDEAIILREKFKIGQLVDGVSAVKSKPTGGTEVKKPTMTNSEQNINNPQHQKPKEDKLFSPVMFISFTIILYYVVIYFLY